jgi:hypothetical protein
VVDGGAGEVLGSVLHNNGCIRSMPSPTEHWLAEEGGWSPTAGPTVLELRMVWGLRYDN